MYIFFDTETTGLPKNWKAPVTDVDNWPRMVQIAWMVFDSVGNQMDEKEFIIQPEGYTIPEASSSVHGITTDRALAEGVDLKFVLDAFELQVERCTTVVAHNINFDEKVVGAEFLRKGIQSEFDQAKKLCTMKATTDFCQIEGQYGYKWPTLSELHIKLFGEDFEDAHDALADIQATARCFWELKKLGVL